MQLQWQSLSPLHLPRLGGWNFVFACQLIASDILDAGTRIQHIVNKYLLIVPNSVFNMAPMGNAFRRFQNKAYIFHVTALLLFHSGFFMNSQLKDVIATKYMERNKCVLLAVRKFHSF